MTWNSAGMMSMNHCHTSHWAPKTVRPFCFEGYETSQDGRTHLGYSSGSHSLASAAEAVSPYPSSTLDAQTTRLSPPDSQSLPLCAQFRPSAFPSTLDLAFVDSSYHSETPEVVSCEGYVPRAVHLSSIPSAQHSDRHLAPFLEMLLELSCSFSGDIKGHREGERRAADLARERRGRTRGQRHKPLQVSHTTMLQISSH